MTGSPQPRLRDTIVGGAYAWYVLGILFLVYVLNFVDRQILSILAQDIKASLGIGDAQIGFLYGTAFAIFYSLFGIPLGRLADGWYRGRLIALGLSVWSAMTAYSGLAASFGQLAVARIGVGIGEASASPAAYSLLGDYFPRERRALVLAIYSAGLLVGAALSLPIGGSIAHSWSRHFAAGDAPFGLAGWQAAFLAVGIPGLLLAAWVLTLREPLRGIADGTPTSVRQPNVWREFGRDIAAILPPFTFWTVSRIPGGLKANLLLLTITSAAGTLLALVSGDILQWAMVGVGVYAAGSWVQKLRSTDRATFELLWGTPAVVLALVSGGTLAFVGYGVAFWIPPYAIRTFHIGTDVAGWMIGVPGGLASAAGCILGGVLSDAWRAHDPRGRIFICMLTMTLAPALVYVQLNAADVNTFYWINPATFLVINMWVGSAAAMIQDCVLPRMRGTAAATFLLVTALLGLALSPYLVGKVSVLTGSLRDGLLGIVSVAPFALFVMWRTSIGLPSAEATKTARAADG
jgi:MFS family permease